MTPDILLARIAAPLRKFAHNLRHPLAAVAAMFAEPGEES